MNKLLYLIEFNKKNKLATRKCIHTFRVFMAFKVIKKLSFKISTYCWCLYNLYKLHQLLLCERFTQICKNQWRAVRASKVNACLLKNKKKY